MRRMTDDAPSKNQALRLDTYWPYQVTVLADRIARRTSRIVKGHHLNLSQWRVLAAIAEVPGRTSAEVVTVTPMDKGIVSRATKALLELGLINRQASQSDGRLSHLYLTKHGGDVYQLIRPQVEDVVIDTHPHLDSHQQTRLSELLSELIAVIPDLR